MLLNKFACVSSHQRRYMKKKEQKIYAPAMNVSRYSIDEVCLEAIGRGGCSRIERRTSNKGSMKIANE